jgi:hypothetical protein
MSSQPPPPFPPANPSFNQPPLPPGKKPNILLWILGGILVVMLGISAMCGLGGYFLYRKAKSSGFDTALLQKNPAYAAAKMAVTMAPGVETVSSDDDKGTVTIRNKEDGKVMTFKFDAEKKTMVVLDENGKEATVKLTGDGDKGGIEINSADGKFQLGGGDSQIPAWVPAYPGSSPTGTFSASNKDGKQGGYSFKTPDAPAKVLSFYQDQLKSAGFTINVTTMGEQGGLVIADNKESNHTVTVTVTPDGGGSNVALLALNK